MTTRLGRLIGLILPLSLALGLVCFTPLQRWDHVFYDLTMGLFARKPDPSIVLVGIDERSIERLGRWPWSRHVHARFLDRLSEVGVRAVGLDVLFAEPDSTDPQSDAALAEAISRNSRVILPLAPVRREPDGEVRIIPPLPRFAGMAAALGHVDIKPDEDNVVRQVYLQAGTRAQHWPFFALAVWNVSRGENTVVAMPDPLSDRWWRADPMLVAYAGPAGTFRQISYVDVLENDEAVRSLQDRVVLVGMTAAGLGQRFATPVSAKAAPMSGPELHGQVLEALQLGLAVQLLGLPWRLGLTALLTILPWLAHVRLNPRPALLWAIAILSLTLIVTVALMKWWALWFPPMAALLGQALGHPWWSWRRLEFAGRSLSREKHHTAAILHAVGDGVIATDTADRVAFMNPVAERLTGYGMAEARGRPLSEIVPLLDEFDSLPVEWAQGAAPADKDPSDLWQRPLFLRNRAGDHHAVRVSINAIASENGRPEGRVVAFSDITETLRISRRMAFLATHDPLTELPNRVLLEDRLAQGIAHARRHKRSLAVLFLDLDNFKKINDGLGHAVGDALLKNVADRLRSTIREVDSAARWGGDEFVIVLEDLLHPESVTEITEKIHAAFAKPFIVADQALYVSFSIGISLFPQDDASGERLLRHADAAMYRVKALGRNQHGFYSKEMNSRAAERLSLEKDLHEALARGEFEVFYQPQWNPLNGCIIGAEALIRWCHKDRGLVMPDTFIPMAEETGLIVPIGEWVIAQACSQARAWRESRVTELPIAINLSPRQFLQPDLYSRIEGAIRGHGLPAHSIKLEITESVMTHDVDKVAKLLRQLKALGVSLAIDDFGTGYSSLNLLKRLPIDQLKIDKTFVRHVVTDPDDAAIAQSVISLAHNMNLSVIAEGVETESQLDFFRRYRCDGLQGNYFSPPLAVREMTRLLAASDQPVTPFSRPAGNGN